MKTLYIVVRLVLDDLDGEALLLEAFGPFADKQSAEQYCGLCNANAGTFIRFEVIELNEPI